MNDDTTLPLLLRGPQPAHLPPFHPRLPWWGGDLQTLRNTLRRPTHDLSPFQAHCLQFPLQDGDTLLGLLNRPARDAGKPLIILIHGLTGSEASRNIIASAAYHLHRHHPVLRLNLRNAGPSLGLCKRLYHAGCSADLHEVFTQLPTDFTANGIVPIGVSLGGNVLLQYLGEEPSLKHVIAAAAVCPPIQLQRAQQRIMASRNALYHRYLLRSLIHTARRLPTPFDRRPPIRTIYEFDDKIVAPNAGFNDAYDYYTRCSAERVLHNIAVPTLILATKTDPWIPTEMFLAQSWPDKGPLTLVVPPDGGHVGFHAIDSAIPWHDRAIGAYLDTFL